MELRHLKYFITLAYEKHFGKAAQKLFITQPTLSHQIKQLEQELGFSLFDQQHRTVSRKVVLSQIGEVFLSKIEPLVLALDRTVDEIKDLKGERTSVRVGVYKILLKERVVEMLDVLHQYFPHINTKLIEYQTSHEVENHLADGSIDLGMTILPHKRKDLHYVIIKQGHLCILINHLHPLAGEKKIQIDKLIDQQWIELHRDIHPFIDQIEDYIIPLGLDRKNRISQEVPSLELMASLIKMNVGIGFVSSLFDVKKEKLLKKIPIVRSDNTKIEILNALAYKNEALKDLVDKLNQIMNG
jgi:DNA-binding transcriptional LysR family regulator